MDFGNAQKVTPVMGITLAPRSDIVATQGGVKVELPPEKTVQSARAGDAVRVDIKERPAREAQDAKVEDRSGETDRQAQIQVQRQQQAVKDTIERRLTIEPATREIVLQKTDLETGETVETVPDEATLKFRRFAREIAERARAAEDTTARYVERTA
ncbi:hypothetical protein [Bosea sp. PAMC 26642]|uniref:hypothetical protein n=1 Tax=Bosea sp. (strain PAMC 26642) TaxID=1792307 RepID=UPI0007702F79|nr:hypothetical protein [Bosea sp. PAMC 26642]AMJ60535.1 hypothetical protein AXW83_09755 [Bosea sp. PAMC 26642]